MKCSRYKRGVLSSSLLTILLLPNCIGPLPADEGKLPPLDGSALTHLNAANLSGKLAPSDGSALTNLSAANIAGALPAIDGSSLTGLNLNAVCCRLSLVSTQPMSSADQTGGTLSLVAFHGNMIPIFNGTSWTNSIVSDGSGTSVIPSVTVPPIANTNFDVFAFNNSGTVGLELSLAWIDATNRATAIGFFQGVYVKTSDNTRRYLGTFRTTAAGTTEDSKKRRLVWNYYNRLPRPILVPQTPITGWTLGAGIAWRQAGGNSANQVELVIGFAEDVVQLHAIELVVNNYNALANFFVTLVEDSTPPGGNPDAMAAQAQLAAYVITSAISDFTKTPAAGYHTYKWMETSASANDLTIPDSTGKLASHISGQVFN